MSAAFPANPAPTSGAAPVRPRSRWQRWSVLALLLLAAGGFIIWDHLLRCAPAPEFSSDAELFKYGGLAAAPGFPYYIWKVLPDLFADKLPGGWPALGLIL